jgi:hypothetical protein
MVSPSLNENFPGPGEIVDAKYLNNAMLDYFDRMNIKLLINTKTKKGIKGGVGTFYDDLVFSGGGDFIKLKDIVSVEIIESSVNEAKEEDKVDTITMDVPLFIRMLEYSREDAAADVDLHDVTEKAIALGKERGILQMDDYDEIIGTTEKVNEVNLKQAKLSSAEYQQAKKLKDFKASDWKWNADEDLYTKVVKEGMGGQLDEPYFIEVSVRDARKALDLFQDQYRKSNIEMYGSNVYAANTPEDIYDLYYNLTSQDIEILDSSDFEEDLDEAKHKEKGLKKRISEALNKINEELCPAGKAYRKRRMAAGEKSSAYLSGRAVKVCKGQMSGKAKKK